MDSLPIPSTLSRRRFSDQDLPEVGDVVRLAFPGPPSIAAKWSQHNDAIVPVCRVHESTSLIQVRLNDGRRIWCDPAALESATHRELFPNAVPPELEPGRFGPGNLPPVGSHVQFAIRSTIIRNREAPVRFDVGTVAVVLGHFLPDQVQIGVGDDWNGRVPAHQLEAIPAAPPPAPASEPPPSVQPRQPLRYSDDKPPPLGDRVRVFRRLVVDEDVIVPGLLVDVRMVGSRGQVLTTIPQEQFGKAGDAPIAWLRASQLEALEPPPALPAPPAKPEPPPALLDYIRRFGAHHGELPEVCRLMHDVFGVQIQHTMTLPHPAQHVFGFLMPGETQPCPQPAPN